MSEGFRDIGFWGSHATLRDGPRVAAASTPKIDTHRRHCGRPYVAAMPHLEHTSPMGDMADTSFKRNRERPGSHMRSVPASSGRNEKPAAATSLSGHRKSLRRLWLRLTMHKADRDC